MQNDLSYEVLDTNGKPLAVGMEVELEGGWVGRVDAITEPDIDWSDAAGRATMTNPVVTITFQLSTDDNTKVTWADYPDGPSKYVFGCDVRVLS